MSEKLKFYTLLLPAIVALTAAFALAQPSDANFEKQIDQIFSGYGRETPGVAVAVVKDGKVVFSKGYGSANLEHRLPVTPKTVFQIGSVSKQFTAFATYLLEKQGKISLEDDLRKYIPELPDYGKTIRIRHLLAHTSGVKDQSALLTLAGWRMDDVTTTPQVLRLLSRQKELNFEPGTQFLYSNSGYLLLAEIIRRASGRSFAEYTRKNIFEPLGMNDTEFPDDHEKTVRNRADSYELKDGSYKKIALNNSADGPSNLHTTVEDMAKWVLNFEKPVIGDAELIRRFNEPSLFNNGARVVWAVIDGSPGYHAKGQILWNERGVKRFSHGGHAGAFRSFLGRFPDQRLGVVALSNDEHYLNADTSMRVAELYLKEVMQPAPPASAAPARTPQAITPNANLKEFEGRFYSGELDSAYTVKTAAGKLMLSHIRHGDIGLTDAGKDKFSGRIEFPVQIEFVRSASGSVTEMRVSNFGAKNVKFEKVAN
jgi:CubicO group peptidase (beta-lactamase class C family)